MSTGSGIPTWPGIHVELRKHRGQGGSAPPLQPAEEDLAEPGRVVVEEHTDDYTLDSGDYGKILMMNAGTAKTFTLPAVVADDIGLGITLVKRGEGKLTIQAGGTDTIQGSSAGGTLWNGLSQAESTLPLVRLCVIAAGVWIVEYSTGTEGWVPT